MLVNLDKIRLDNREHLEAAVSCAKIINGDLIPPSPIMLNGFLEKIIVMDGAFFGNFKNYTVFRYAPFLQQFIGYACPVSSVHHCIRAHIYKQMSFLRV